MKSLKKKDMIGRLCLPIVVAVGVALVLLWVYPYVMVAREQSLLFLWNADYFYERLMIPGGMAQWLGECLVQFFYNPYAGAFIYGVLCLMAQLLTSRLIPRFFWLSLLPPLLIGFLATRFNIPLTFTVALLLTMLLMTLLPKQQKNRLICIAVLIPIGYWLLGPAIILLLLSCIKWSPMFAIWLAACMLGSLWLTPYPLRQIVRGIDYYWEETNPNTMEEMECDFLVKTKRWKYVLDRFSASENPAVQNAVWVARWQCGLVGKSDLSAYLDFSGRALHSQSSAFIMSDVCMQLGMLQMAGRCAFEAMETIPNYNKSARVLHRLAVINIINGYTEVALKYISLLEETFAYRDIAQRLRPLAEHPETIKIHPIYKQLKEIYDNTDDTFFY